MSPQQTRYGDSNSAIAVTHCSRKVSDFLSSHRDTIAILLKSEPDVIPLALIEEVHLLVSVCGSVLPFIPKSELVSARC